jgi:hypothetical protein
MVAGAVALSVALAACGDDADERAAAPPPALPAAAVPYLDSSARPLTAASVAKEAGVPELAGRLEAWGFDGGSRRYFQGQSRRLQVVDSRALRFRSAAGAAAFVRYVRSRPSEFLAGGGPAKDLEAGGRRGVLILGSPCSCHLATPVLTGVVADGPTVAWLEINGPRATRAALRRLLAGAV